MVTRVAVAPDVLHWAVERSGRDEAEIADRFPALDAWEAGVRQPTLKQLEDFASATRTPLGFLLLPAPIDEPLPIADYRTIKSRGVGRPSADLLDTIYLCQQRQDWYREHALVNAQESIAFVASLTFSASVRAAAAQIAAWLGYDEEARRGIRYWSEALRWLADAAEKQGVLVMVSGIVGSNTHRRLDPIEFRGFSLADNLAPLVFVNGADTKAAQIFSLMHEICHLWLGDSGVSNVAMNVATSDVHERWCNEVAAEVLVPTEHLLGEYRDQGLDKELDRLARVYKVSTLVVLRRLFDIRKITWDEFSSSYDDELDRLLEIQRETTGGGDFYNTQPVRVSKRFARAIIADALEGQTLHRDAFRLLGFRKYSTFKELSRRLGVA